MKKLLLFVRLAPFLVVGAVTAFAQKVPPKILNHPIPGYPRELTNTGLEGTAEVDVVLKADGTIANAQLGMATHRAFGKTALAAIKDWTFTPATVDGVAVDKEATIPFHFVPPFEQVVNSIAKREVFVEVPQPVVSEKDFPGKKLKVKQPSRPQIPRSLAGTPIDEVVMVKFVISPEGKTLNPVAAEAKHKELERAAVTAVALMTFEPCMVNGKAAYVEATAQVPFVTPRSGGFTEPFGAPNSGPAGRGGGGGGDRDG